MSAPKPKALLLGKLDHKPAQEDWQALSQHAELITPRSTTREQFIQECKSGGFDGVVAILRTFDSISATGRYDSELMKAMPKSLKFLCHNGAGYDAIDVPACTSVGVHVSNTPGAVDDSTADTGIFLMLGALRNFSVSQAALRRGEWRGKELPALGHDPQGKVLGIVGMGGIGRNMARKARVFGMSIKYYNRRQLSKEEEDGAEYAGFEDLLKTSDVLSLNVPLNPQTRHTISKKELAMMKPTAIIINTARGAVIDEAALVEAIDEGRIAGVGLDVFEDEPKIHPGLMTNDKVCLLPHMGTWSVETQMKMEKLAVANVKAALTKGELVTRVPEQKDVSY